MNRIKTILSAAVVSLLLPMNAFAWSGSMIPEGKLPSDQFAFTLEQAEAAGFSDDEIENLAYIIQEKPVDYWMEYTLQFGKRAHGKVPELIFQNRGNRTVSFLINRLLFSAAAFSNPDLMQNGSTIETIKRDMVVYSTTISTWNRTRHMNPNEFQAFLNTEACNSAFGSWYCTLMAENGFNWETKDGINYLYVVNDDGRKSIEDAVSHAIFN